MLPSYMFMTCKSIQTLYGVYHRVSHDLVYSKPSYPK
nr:MAG TPA: YmgD protein [Caudoviricetes sp.]DAK31271.1 MAG TPA: YmgD protein [Caudoviricetes sp.]